MALNSDFRESFTPDSIYIAVYQLPKNHNITERRSAWLNNRSRGRSLNEATTGNFLNNCPKKTSKTLALIYKYFFIHLHIIILCGNPFSKNVSKFFILCVFFLAPLLGQIRKIYIHTVNLRTVVPGTWEF